MEASQRRLAVVGGHFEPLQRSARPEAPAVAQLQNLLDHDNHELRQRMKDFFQSDDIYIPRCVPATP
jgi:hypothetical protein